MGAHSNVYPQSMFSALILKKIKIFLKEFSNFTAEKKICVDSILHGRCVVTR